MSVFLVTHPACAAHDPGPGHPERPGRLAAVTDALAGGRFRALERVVARPATDEQVGRVHPPAFRDRLRALRPLTDGRVALDADTVVGPGSVDAALLAAGAACDAVDLVLGGRARHAFAAVRPPGHHAEPTRAMGFCLLSTVAVAALHARAAHGIRRVAVLDFDVHHGNGTQAVAWNDPDFLLAGSHQMPLYPGTGAADERGACNNVVNAPLRPGDGGRALLAAWDDILLPAVARFRPELVIVSAGFDGHRDDPLAQLALDEADFASLTARILAVAGHRIVSSLEGGYDLDALAGSTAAHVETLLRDPG